jgi:hypothetical protein
MCFIGRNDDALFDYEDFYATSTFRMRCIYSPSLAFEHTDLFPEYILISEIFKYGNHMRTLGAAQTGTGRDPSYWPGRSAAPWDEPDLLAKIMISRNGNEHAALDR